MVLMADTSFSGSPFSSEKSFPLFSPDPLARLLCQEWLDLTQEVSLAFSWKGFSANSPGLRLLNSLGYEYAKYMSQFCPVDSRSGDLLHKEFFAGAFQRFWDHFPSLLEANEESFKAICLLRKTDPSRVRGYKGLGLMTKTRANMSSFFLRFARRAKGIAE